MRRNVGGLCAVVLLPAYVALRDGRIAAVSSGFNWLSPAALGRDLMGVASAGFQYEAVPNIYCGVAVVLLCACFFFMREVPLRDKLITGGFAAVIALSFCLPALNALFHLFTAPSLFLYRHAFIAPFFMVTLACRALGEPKADGGVRKLRPKKNGNGFWTTVRDVPLGAAVVLGLYIAVSFTLPDKGQLAIALMFLAGYGLLLLMWRSLTAVPSRCFVGALFALLLCCDMFINADKLIQILDNDRGYSGYTAWSDAHALTEPVISEITRMDDGFYRIEKEYQRTYNDSIALGYNSMTHYSSAYAQRTNGLLRNLGLGQAWLYSSGYDATVVADALLCVKYRLALNEGSQDGALPGYDQRFSANGVLVYENPYVLPVAALSRLTLPSIGEDDPFQWQNALVRGLSPEGGDVLMRVPCGVTPIGAELRGIDEFVRTGAEEAKLLLSITTGSDGPLYLYMPARTLSNTTASVYAGGRYIGGVDDVSGESRMFSLGEYPPGVTVSVTIEMHVESIRIGGYLVYQLDAAKMAAAAAAARSSGLTVNSIWHNGLSGTIDAPDGGWLYTSIPFSSGWKMTADGRPVEITSYADALLCAFLPSGTQWITIRFIPPGLLAGAATSGVVAVAWAVWWLWRRRVTKKISGRRDQNIIRGMAEGAIQ